MLSINIISVGKLKEGYWREAEREYIKRLNPYTKIDIKEVVEEKVTSVSDRQRIISIEGNKLLKLINSDDTVIALDRVGVEYTSTEWSNKLEDWSKFGKGITFIIGGPLGISPEVLGKVRILLSLSKLTFTHQMSRVILLEQIYRGLMIQKGKQYHY